MFAKDVMFVKEGKERSTAESPPAKVIILIHLDIDRSALERRSPRALQVHGVSGASIVLGSEAHAIVTPAARAMPDLVDHGWRDWHGYDTVVPRFRSKAHLGRR
jgi:hypothetical protein